MSTPVSDNGNEVLRKSARIAGKNEYYLQTNGSASKSSFGDSISEQSQYVIQQSAQNGIRSNVETFTATGGSVSVTDNMFTCTTGTSVGGYGVIRSKKAGIYREGQGLTARFTAIFDENALANSVQGAGLFNVQDTLAFGYYGADFGIIYESYGAQQRGIIEITAAASGSETVTLTLNSVAYSIPVTNGTPQHNAYEIEQWLNDSNNQTLWTAQQIDNSISFFRNNVGAAGGTYSVSSSGTLAGTVSIEQTGSAKDLTFISQSDWNGKSLNNFNQHFGNIYMIKFSYLGFGPSYFYILDPESKEFINVHTISEMSEIEKPVISNRALKIGWYAASLGSSGTSLTVRGASASVAVDGDSRLLVETDSISASNPSVGTTFTSILTLKPRDNFNSKAVLGAIRIKNLAISSDSSKEIRFFIAKNAALGETNFNYVEESESIALYDSTAHSFTTGKRVFDGQIGAAGNANIDLSDYNIDLVFGDSITVFARVVSGAASSVTAGLVWKEDF